MLGPINTLNSIAIGVSLSNLFFLFMRASGADFPGLPVIFFVTLVSVMLTYAVIAVLVHLIPDKTEGV